jgi:ribosomal protein S27E
LSRRDSCNSTFLAIECPRCQDYSERRLAWLRTARMTTCDKCGVPIDLSTGGNRIAIDGYIDLSSRLDAEYPR